MTNKVLPVHLTVEEKVHYRNYYGPMGIAVGTVLKLMDREWLNIFNSGYITPANRGVMRDQNLYIIKQANRTAYMNRAVEDANNILTEVYKDLMLDNNEESLDLLEEYRTRVTILIEMIVISDLLLEGEKEVEGD